MAVGTITAKGAIRRAIYTHSCDSFEVVLQSVGAVEASCHVATITDGGVDHLARLALLYVIVVEEGGVAELAAGVVGEGGVEGQHGIWAAATVGCVEDQVVRGTTSYAADRPVVDKGCPRHVGVVDEFAEGSHIVPIEIQLMTDVEGDEGGVEGLIVEGKPCD